MPIIVSTLGFPSTDDRGSADCWHRQRELGVTHIPSNSPHDCPVQAFKAAKQDGVHTRPVVVSPLSGPARLGVAETRACLKDLAAAGADWVQVDEFCLTVPLDDAARGRLLSFYQSIAEATPSLKILVNAGRGSLGENRRFAVSLPIAGLHVDCTGRGDQFSDVVVDAPAGLYLSLGLVDAKDRDQTDIGALLPRLEAAAFQRGLAIASGLRTNPWPTDLGSAPQDLDGLAIQLGLDRLILAPGSSLADASTERAEQCVAALTLLAQGLAEGRSVIGSAVPGSVPPGVLSLAQARSVRSAA
ncbi:hypothetical protein FHS85_003784 [Rhodoligotrophos appendicifer]|uniref:hypothetical protein n=1 Tax=Rhodoligotrophos appendicifer TaxID=987056 RepID=UPI0011858856|nr:hypothetical protein [Rhodoligotrophos appendicifer]